jgi:hypothetical protein
VTAVYNCLWNVGAITCTWLTFGTKRFDNDWCWRVPALSQAFPSIIQLVFIFFIPESPRWLIAKGRNEEALNILGKYHANGDLTHPTVQYEFQEIRETLRIEFQYQTTSSYLDFFRTRGNRYRLLLLASLGLFSQWSGNGLVSYYATDVYDSIGITDKDMQLCLSGGLTMMQLVVSVSCALLVDRFGRRPLFIAATASMCVCFVTWTIASSQQEHRHSVPAGRAVIAMIWIFSFSYALAWTGLLVAYTVEILPFKIRAKGLMVMNVFIQVALAINQWVNPFGFQHLKPTWKFYSIYAVSTYQTSQAVGKHTLTITDMGLPRTCLRLLLLHRNAGPDPRRSRQNFRRRPGRTCERSCRSIRPIPGHDIGVREAAFAFGSLRAYQARRPSAINLFLCLNNRDCF